MSDEKSNGAAVGSTELLGKCAGCGCLVRVENKFCLSCCRKQTPDGQPLKRLRKYGFKVSYSQRQDMNAARDICGAIPTEVCPVDQSVKVSHLFVACDGKTYISHEWIGDNGGCYSWNELYQPNASHQPERAE